MDHIGIDVHKNASQVCIRTETGQLIERRVRTDRESFFKLVPPQNPIDRTIADVSPLGIELAYPDASLAVRPARNRQIEPEAAARARACRAVANAREGPSSVHLVILAGVAAKIWRPTMF
jgi:hypothetical protein